MSNIYIICHLEHEPRHLVETLFELGGRGKQAMSVHEVCEHLYRYLCEE